MDHPQQFQEDQEDYERWCAERDAAVPPAQSDDYVAWCRYTDRTIVTCDSDAEGAFRVYRRGDADTMAIFNKMADCLDDIRKILDCTDYASRLNRLQAIRDRINFDIPETPRDIQSAAHLLADELARYTGRTEPQEYHEAVQKAAKGK